MMSPGQVHPGEAGSGIAFVNVELITGRVVDLMEQRLKIKPGVEMGGAEWNGDHRQGVSQANRPEPRLGTITRTAHQDRVST